MDTLKFIFMLCIYIYVSSIQSLSCVQLFATPWIAARQASLSITNNINPFMCFAFHINAKYITFFCVLVSLKKLIWSLALNL